MGKSNRPKMSIENRAKQFMPFAALKGFEDAIRMREHVIVDKAQLSEEKLSELDEKLDIIREQLVEKKSAMATIIYYDVDEYVKVTGMITKIDTDAKIIKVVNNKIKICDIYDIIVQN